MTGMPSRSRPGLVLGEYPEKQTETHQWLEESLSGYWLRLESARQFSKLKLNKVIDRIEAAGQSLGKMPDDVLDMSVAGLRIRLARSDADSSLEIQAFAMIREVAGRVMGMRPYRSQLKGGWVLYNGLLAEMQTGEGKTLTATLPAATAALSGMPVHVITSNDYLAKRDSELMQPVYERLGLSVAYVIEGMDMDERRSAYRCDITYTTNKQIAFDYLRDRVAKGNSGSVMHLKCQRLYGEAKPNQKLLLRGLCFAVVDEADSVLVDEARTPLILSRPVEGSEQPDTYREALHLSAQLSLDTDFILHPKQGSAELTERGKAKCEQLAEDMDPIWKAGRRREELVCQALVAEHVFIRDRHYLVKDDKVQIIDNYTGRLMPDRSWERGLHQMVEIKEGCSLSDDKETLARMSYQRFFRRYLRLGGMTGTTDGIEHELARVYRLPVVGIPTHKPCIRKRLKPRTFITAKHRNRAIIESVKKLHADRRPVLIGTSSVEMSERLGMKLEQEGITVKILNARQDESEAEVVAQAGQPGAVTVATNMAGRGTDIKLSDAARANGGLHVIISERNDASRIDRQLVGRCSRQGDPGSFQFITSMEDDIPAKHFSPLMRVLLRVCCLWRGELPSLLGQRLMDDAQLVLELRHRKARRSLEKQDERLGDMLSFTGKAE